MAAHPAEAPFPAVLVGYLGTRSPDGEETARRLARMLPRFGSPAPITSADHPGAGLAPCGLGAELVLLLDVDAVAGHIVADRWSVSARGRSAWIDVEWSVEAWANSRIGGPATGIVDLPFLPGAMKVVSHEQHGGFFRFECLMDYGASAAPVPSQGNEPPPGDRGDFGSDASGGPPGS